jgi:hypothetical protein
MADYKCLQCADTGIIKADVVKRVEDGKVFNEKVNTVICGGHFDTSLSEKTIALIHEASGLSVEIVGVQRVDET